MDTTGQTNGDKMLRIVLSDEHLINYGEYNPNDYETVDDALNSECAIVVAVAKFIQGHQRKYTPKEIYNEIQNYLNANL